MVAGRGDWFRCRSPPPQGAATNPCSCNETAPCALTPCRPCTNGWHPLCAPGGGSAPSPGNATPKAAPAPSGLAFPDRSKPVAPARTAWPARARFVADGRRPPPPGTGGSCPGVPSPTVFPPLARDSGFATSFPPGTCCPGSVSTRQNPKGLEGPFPATFWRSDSATRRGQGPLIN